MCVASAILVFWQQGWSSFKDSLWIASVDSLFVFPLITLALLVGGLLTAIIPPKLISNYLGHQSGMKGILVSTMIGTIVPGGPFAAFPIIVALGKAGAGIGPLIAFMTAWTTLGLQRVLVWELPFLGADFAILRFICSIPLPIIAGVLAYKLTETWEVFRLDWDKQ